ncbi:pyrimidodiazepine synthase-like isoform X2 [Maniola hyperantus]|uniref:pyrimidodiazepine synthase-like isoform X2 n=1 Tax=Aphantopus hyperantus TaxID=2795564 RepID=UPI0015689992|nr:pyrimidodiazepine synthase-like [Maniola hyperantus]
MAKAVAGKINFNTKHLKRGDPLPPYNGKLRIYSMRLCPFAQRTILALNAKNIDFEVVNISLAEKPEWLTSKSAFGTVPSIEIKEDVCIYGSLIAVEYLDEVYPQRPLLPKDPVRKAMDKIIVEASGPITTFVMKTVKAPETITEETVSAFHKALEFIQNQLKERGTPYLAGDAPGYVDYMNWPWFERLLGFKEEDRKIDSEKFKLLTAYLGKMKKDPAVVPYLVPDNVMNTFHEGFKTGPHPNYDLLDSQLIK